jgi:hypothetical protein
VRWKEDQERKTVEEDGNAVFEDVTGIVLKKPRKIMQILGYMTFEADTYQRNRVHVGTLPCTVDRQCGLTL